MRSNSLSDTLKLIAVSYLFALFVNADQELDRCGCQPPYWVFQLNFSAPCASPFGPEGVESQSCRFDIGRRSDDTTFSSIESAFVAEFDQNGDQLRGEVFNGPLRNGEIIEYSSILNDEESILSDPPRSIGMVLRGTNTEGAGLLAQWSVVFTNECYVYPVVEGGESTGGTIIQDVADPLSDFCPPPPTLNPIESLPTFDPTESLPTLDPTESSLLTLDPTEAESDFPSMVPSEVPSEPPLAAPTAQSPTTEPTDATPPSCSPIHLVKKTKAPKGEKSIDKKDNDKVKHPKDIKTENDGNSKKYGKDGKSKKYGKENSSDGKLTKEYKSTGKKDEDKKKAHRTFRRLGSVNGGIARSRDDNDLRQLRQTGISNTSYCEDDGSNDVAKKQVKNSKSNKEASDNGENKKGDKTLDKKEKKTKDRDYKLQREGY